MDRHPASDTAPSRLARAMSLITRLVVRFPVATLALAVGLAAVSLALTATRLGFRTSRLDLLNPESAYNRLWLEYIKEFGDEDDAVVLVEGAHRDQVVTVLRELSAALVQQDHLFHAILHKVDLSKIRSKGLHYLPQEELLAIESFVREVEPILDGDWSRLNLVHMARGLGAQLEADLPPAETTGRAARASAGGACHEIGRLAESMSAALDERQGYVSPWPGIPASVATLSELGPEYLLANEGRLGLILLRLARGDDGFARGNESITALRELIARTAARHPETKIGLTGLPVMEHDEMKASQSSMFWASLVSFVGVACLFVAGFGGIRHALLANLVLLLGMAWSFGYVTLVVGHLNILSVSFTVTLIGIGIDYGVYYVARYLQLRRERLVCDDALVRTSIEVGPAILAGAVTTATAFFAAGFTSFVGIAELGIIAAGGILLCAVAELVVLPAAICLVDRGRLGERLPNPLPIHAGVAFATRAPRLVFGASLALTAAAALGLGHLWYDHNLLNLQPVGLESVELERKLLGECSQSAWFALSIANSREELLARKSRFLKLKSVERTEEIVSLLPSDHPQKRPVIERIAARLANLRERPPLIPVASPEELGVELARAGALLYLTPEGRPAADQLNRVRDQLRRLPLTDCYARLSRLQQQMAGDLLTRLYALRSIANPESPRLADLPASLVTRFVGQHGRHLLKIYGRGNIWDMQALRRFVADVRTVDPRVTGNPLQTYEASLEMKHSYEQAALLALAVILGVLWFDLRSIKDSLLAVVPLTLGMAATFGVLGWMDIPLNPANMIALPLVLGLGIDYGIHIVHEHRERGGPYRMGAATAIAVTVDGLTTIVGYGSLMIASHQGLQSLGRVLTIAITCCMLASMIALPALLAWLSRNCVKAESEVEPPRLQIPHPHYARDRQPHWVAGAKRSVPQ